MKNKDVIYIDIDDDITAVIDKVKQAKEDIVALVPPKRNGVLQSVVNLKLLQRKAEAANHHIVLVTSDRATTALAGSLGLFVAKNLQTKPEVPTVSSVMEDLDDEEAESIAPPQAGELAAAAASQAVTDEDLQALNPNSKEPLKIHDNNEANLGAAAAGGEAGALAAKKVKKGNRRSRIPNFGGFRKKLLIIGGLVLLAIIILVVVLTQTGKTVVTIHGQTSSVGIDFNLNVDANAVQTDAKNNIIKAQSQELKKSVTQSFQATGQKNIGKKATGTLEMTATKCGGNPFSIPSPVPSGSTVTANNVSFVTQQSVSFHGTGASNGCFTYSGDGSTPVTATKPGGDYNIDSSSFAVSGRSDVTANGTTSGGTDQVVQIITQKDVDGAVSKAKSQDNSGVKKELAGQFDKDLRVLDDSFTATAGTPSVTPNVGDQASQGTVTIQYTYTELAISNDDLNAVLDNQLSGQIKDSSKQRIYKNGFDTIKMTVEGQPSASKVSYHVVTLGYVGPQFNEDDIKNQISGKKYGQIVSTVQQIPGVNSVDVHFSPFWSRQAGPASRIQINLDVSKAASDNL
jgi:hypothetical protein